MAQRQKLKKVAALLDLRPGDRVLDVGGGWGEFARYAATEHGCVVTSINIAEEQIKFAREYCKDTGVEIRRCDYRDITGRFDKIVVMAMLTHVGYKNYRGFMEIMDRCLEPGGLMLVDLFVGGHKSRKNCEPWINRTSFRAVSCRRWSSLTGPLPGYSRDGFSTSSAGHTSIRCGPGTEISSERGRLIGIATTTESVLCSSTSF